MVDESGRLDYMHAVFTFRETMKSLGRVRTYHLVNVFYLYMLMPSSYRLLSCFRLAHTPLLSCTVLNSWCIS